MVSLVGLSFRILLGADSDRGVFDPAGVVASVDGGLGAWAIFCLHLILPAVTLGLSLAAI